MTNIALNPFSFESYAVRTLTDDCGEPWFVAADVCAVLGYVNPWDAIKKHCREKGLAKREALTEGGKQELTVVNEGNLYRLIIKCRLPVAERLEAWVCDEVLPTIRKTGQYTAPNYHAEETRDVRQLGLTKEQQDAIKAHHKALVSAVPHERQGKLAITLWSSIKSKFGVSYKDVPPSDFVGVLSLMSRVAIDGEYMPKQMPENSVFDTLKAIESVAFNARWITSARKGQMYMTPIEQGAYVVTADEMAGIISHAGITEAQTFAILQACVEKLRQMNKIKH